jgi:hypothetical protein
MTYRFRINPNARWNGRKPGYLRGCNRHLETSVRPGFLAPYSNILWGKYEERSLKALT